MAGRDVLHLHPDELIKVEAVRHAISNFEQIDAAFVFGSTVRGDTRPDSDVDVFIVGDRAFDVDVSTALGEVDVS
jgi:predicted nucleotidyltransferase